MLLSKCKIVLFFVLVQRCYVFDFCYNVCLVHIDKSTLIYCTCNHLLFYVINLYDVNLFTNSSFSVLVMLNLFWFFFNNYSTILNEFIFWLKFLLLLLLKLIDYSCSILTLYYIISSISFVINKSILDNRLSNT